MFAVLTDTMFPVDEIIAGFELNLVQGALPERVVRFTVPGEPRSKQRPRVTAKGTFTPKETLEAERLVRNTWRALGEPMFEHQVVVDIEFYNGNRRRRDLDNMAKLVLDALNGEAFDDDYRVIELNLRKIFTTKDGGRSVVTIREVVDWPDESKAVLEIPGT